MASFNIKDFREGQDMTVGAINGIPTDVRWAEETEIFSELISEKISDLGLVNQEAVEVLDFGCGVGRMVKPLLNNHSNLRIMGVDQAMEMLTFAEDYIHSERFKAQLLSNFMFVEKTFDFAICIYCLQHVRRDLLRPVVEKLVSIAPRLLIVNSVSRMALPDFRNDDVNVLSLLKEYYTRFENILTGDLIVKNMVLRKMFLEGPLVHYAFVCRND